MISDVVGSWLRFVVVDCVCVCCVVHWLWGGLSFLAVWGGFLVVTYGGVLGWAGVVLLAGWFCWLL